MDLKELNPNAADITTEAIKYIERPGWYVGGACDQDQDEGEGRQSRWLAILFNTEGDYLTTGQAPTACQAAAKAWLWTWHPFDETWDGVMLEFKPDDFRLELFPPGTWEYGSPEWDDTGNGVLPSSWVERRREALASPQTDAAVP
jgi:hypothetical protein